MPTDGINRLTKPFPIDQVITLLKSPSYRPLFPIILMMTALSPGVFADAPWYQFEIIIFERIDRGAGGTEIWPEGAGRPVRLDARSLRLRGTC